MLIPPSSGKDQNTLKKMWASCTTYFGGTNAKVILFFLAVALVFNLVSFTESTFTIFNKAYHRVDNGLEHVLEVPLLKKVMDHPEPSPIKHHPTSGKSLPTHMVVGVVTSPPIAFLNTTTQDYEGIGVELVNSMAAKLGIHVSYVPVSMENARYNLENGYVDLLVGPFKVGHAMSMGNPSIPFLHTSLGIASNQTQATYLQSFWLLLTSEKFLIPIVTLLIILALGAGFLIIIEARTQKTSVIDKPLLQRFFNAFSWSTFAFSGVEMEKLTNRAAQGYAVIFMIVAIFASAGITASMSSSLTLQQMAPIVSNPQDLRHVRVGAAIDSPGSQYLLNEHIPYVPYPSLHEAVRAAMKGDITAVVADEVSLRYIESTISKGSVENHHHPSAGGTLPQLALLPINLTRSAYVFILPHHAPWASAFNTLLQSLQNEDRSVYKGILFQYLGYMPH